MATLSQEFYAALETVKGWAGLMPETVDTAVLDTLKNEAETAATSEVTKLDPSLAPVINPLIDEAITKIDADLTAQIATLQAEAQAKKDALSAARPAQ